VELAGQLASMARQFQRDFHGLATGRTRIVLVEAGSDLLAAFSAPLRAHAQRKLAGMGVEVRLATKAVGLDERGIDVQPEGGQTERIPAGTLVWAAGVRASALGALLGEATGASVDHRGRVKVAPDCSLPGHPEVFAIGDMADLNGLPGLAEPAMQEGRYVATLIERRLAGRPAPRAFRYRDLGAMATISAGDAVAEAFGLRLTGLSGRQPGRRFISRF
jgi:NADH dehydrogenase